jgi:hypothetical protein
MAMNFREIPGISRSVGNSFYYHLLVVCIFFALIPIALFNLDIPLLSVVWANRPNVKVNKILTGYLFGTEPQTCLSVHE